VGRRVFTAIVSACVTPDKRRPFGQFSPTTDVANSRFDNRLTKNSNPRLSLWIRRALHLSPMPHSRVNSPRPARLHRGGRRDRPQELLGNLESAFSKSCGPRDHWQRKEIEDRTGPETDAQTTAQGTEVENCPGLDPLGRRGRLPSPCESAGTEDLKDPSRFRPTVPQNRPRSAGREALPQARVPRLRAMLI